MAATTAVITNYTPAAAQQALARIKAGSADTPCIDVDAGELAYVYFDPACAPGFTHPDVAERTASWAKPVPMREAVHALGEDINTHPYDGSEVFDSEVATENACLIDAATWFFDIVHVMTYIPEPLRPHEGASYQLMTLTRDTATGEIAVDIARNLDADSLDARVPDDALLIHGLTAEMERYFTHPVSGAYAFNPAIAPHLRRPSVELFGHIIEDIVEEYYASKRDEVAANACSTTLTTTPVARIFDVEDGAARTCTAREALDTLGFFDDQGAPDMVFTKCVSTKGPNAIIDVETVCDTLNVYDPTSADIGYAIHKLAEVTDTHNYHQRTVLIQPCVEFSHEVRFFLVGTEIVAAGGRLLHNTPDVCSLMSIEDVEAWCDSVERLRLKRGEIASSATFSQDLRNETATHDDRIHDKIALAHKVAHDIVERFGPQFVSIDMGTMHNPATGETTVSVVEVNHGVNSGYFSSNPYCVMRALARTWHDERSTCTGDGWLTWRDIAPGEAATNARLKKLLGAGFATLTPVTAFDDE